MDLNLNLNIEGANIVTAYNDNPENTIRAARRACLNGTDEYFGAADGQAMLHPRNEAAALSLILERMKTSKDAGASHTCQTFVEQHIAPLTCPGAGDQLCMSEADAQLQRQACSCGLLSGPAKAHGPSPNMPQLKRAGGHSREGSA